MIYCSSNREAKQNKIFLFHKVVTTLAQPKNRKIDYTKASLQYFLLIWSLDDNSKVKFRIMNQIL